MSRPSAALTSATQHSMPLEFGRNWGTKCLNGSLCPAVCGIQREADLFFYFYIIQSRNTLIYVKNTRMLTILIILNLYMVGKIFTRYNINILGIIIHRTPIKTNF